MTDRSSAWATELGYSRWGQALYVLIGHDSNELAREKTDRPAARLADAFTQYGYPWRTEGDPRAEGGKQYWRLTNRPDSLDA